MTRQIFWLKRFIVQDPQDRPSAQELLADPWLLSSRSSLRSTWNKTAGFVHRGLKPRDAHETVQSVVQRILAAESPDSSVGSATLKRNSDQAANLNNPATPLLLPASLAVEDLSGADRHGSGIALLRHSAGKIRSHMDSTSACLVQRRPIALSDSVQERHDGARSATSHAFTSRHNDSGAANK